MSKQSGIYKVNNKDVTVVIKMDIKLRDFLELQPQHNFRSLPMQIIAMLDKYRYTDIKEQGEFRNSERTKSMLKEFKSRNLRAINKEDKPDNKRLYTEEELNDIYKKNKEDNNVNRR